MVMKRDCLKITRVISNALKKCNVKYFYFLNLIIFTEDYYVLATGSAVAVQVVTSEVEQVLAVEEGAVASQVQEMAATDAKFLAQCKVTVSLFV